jgi:hypothetical protein
MLPRLSCGEEFPRLSGGDGLGEPSGYIIIQRTIIISISIIVSIQRTVRRHHHTENRLETASYRVPSSSSSYRVSSSSSYRGLSAYINKQRTVTNIIIQRTVIIIQRTVWRHHHTENRHHHKRTIKNEPAIDWNLTGT